MLAGFALGFIMNISFLFDLNSPQLVDLVQVGISDLYNMVNFASKEGSTSFQVDTINETPISSSPTNLSVEWDRPISPGTEPNYELFSKTKSADARIREAEIEQELLDQTHITKEKYDKITDAIETAAGIIAPLLPEKEETVIKVLTEAFGRYARSRSLSPVLKDDDHGDGDGHAAAALLMLLANNYKNSSFKFHSLSWFIYVFYSFLFIFTYLNLFGLNSGLKNYFHTRIPSTDLLSNHEYLLVFYNIMVIFFFSFVLIYFVISFIHMVLYLKNNKDPTYIFFGPATNNKGSLLLYNFIKYNFICIFLFSIMFYFYFYLAPDFAINATIIYKMMFKHTIQISYYTGNNIIDYYLFY